VRKKVDVARAKNKTSAELKRIFPEFVLMMAGFMRSLACFRIVAAQEMKEVGGFQLRGAISLTLFVNQEGKSDTGLLLKLPGVNGVAEANGGESRSFAAKGLFVFAQLRDVLAAEDSAVVAQEDHHGGAIGPERAQPHGDAGRVGQDDLRQAGAQRFSRR
jgi:hypothetical protein